MTYTAEDTAKILTELTESFGDGILVDENGNTFDYVDFDPVEEKFILEHGD